MNKLLLTCLALLLLIVAFTLSILLEMSYAMTTRSPTFSADVSMKVSLLSSNVTIIPEFSVFSVVFLFVFASGVGLVVAWESKKLARFG